MMDASTELRMKTQSHTNWDATVPALWQNPIRRDACKHQHSSTHYPHNQHVHRRRWKPGRKLVGNIAYSCCLLFFSTYIISHCQIHLVQNVNVPVQQTDSQSASYHQSFSPLWSSTLPWRGLAWRSDPPPPHFYCTSCVLFRHLIQSLHEPWFHHHHQWAVLGVGGAWVRVSFQLSFYHFKMFSFSF